MTRWRNGVFKCEGEPLPKPLPIKEAMELFLKYLKPDMKIDRVHYRNQILEVWHD